MCSNTTADVDKALNAISEELGAMRRAAGG